MLSVAFSEFAGASGAAAAAGRFIPMDEFALPLAFKRMGIMMNHVFFQTINEDSMRSLGLYVRLRGGFRGNHRSLRGVFGRLLSFSAAGFFLGTTLSRVLTIDFATGTMSSSSDKRSMF